MTGVLQRLEQPDETDQEYQMRKSPVFSRILVDKRFKGI